MMDNSDNFNAFEIKLENDKLITKGESEIVTEEHNIDFFDMNVPTNTEIKMDSSMCSNFPKGATTSKMDNFFKSKLQIKVEQKEEDEPHLAQASSISNADRVTFKCEINTEIKLEQQELIIKDEHEEVEELGSLEIIKYDTNPPTLGIRDSTANTEIKVEHSITRVEDLLQICTCDVQVIRLPEHVITSKMDGYVNFNLQDHEFDDNNFQCKACSRYIPLRLFKLHMLCHKNVKHKHGKHGQENLNVYKRIPTVQKRYFTSNHQLKVHENKKPFKCQQCGKGFSQNYNLKVHMFIHENKRPFNCQQCDKGFNRNCDLKEHMLTHEGKTPFKCHQCDKGFFRNVNLKVHMKIHENKRLFKCQQCNKGFNGNCDLKKHMLTHEGKRRFKCQQCDKGFKRKWDLKTHILAHEDKKSFKCQQCDQGFSQNSNLKAHMLIHEDKRPFKCQKCDKKFTYNSYLKQHMLIHENKRPFKCPQCDKGFFRRFTLNRHMLSHENKRNEELTFKRNINQKFHLCVRAVPQ